MDVSDEENSFPTVILYVAVFGAALFLLRRYLKGAQFTERASAKEKVFVITGANSGLGLETAREINLRKGKVYMLCRSEERANDARIKLVRMGCDATRLIYEQCDLASFESIRKCADNLKKAERHIDVLINNAAVMFYPKFELTTDGHEMTWQSNHLGHVLLTELLLPLLQAAPAARVICVSSLLHKRAKGVDLSSVDSKKSFNMFTPYNVSKLANVMHARELTRRLRKDGVHNVTVNSLHPGACDTNLSRSLFISKPPFKHITAPFSWFFLKTDRDGAQTTLYLALSKKVDGISGKYFADCKLASESHYAVDDDACANLYNYSLEQVGLA